MGRPSKLDDLVAKRIVDAVAEGLPRDTAAKLARIHPSTLFDWLRRGRAGEAGYAEFSDRVREAESQGEKEIVTLLRNHAKTSWQACAYLLERRNPKQWAAKKEQPKSEQPAADAGSVEQIAAVAESVLAAIKSGVG